MSCKKCNKELPEPIKNIICEECFLVLQVTAKLTNDPKVCSELYQYIVNEEFYKACDKDYDRNPAA